MAGRLYWRESFLFNLVLYNAFAKNPQHEDARHEDARHDDARHDDARAPPRAEKEKAPGLVLNEAGGPCEEDRRRAALPRS